MSVKWNNGIALVGVEENMHTRTCAYANIHTHANMYVYTYTCTHTHLHTQAHICIHTYIRLAQNR